MDTWTLAAARRSLLSLAALAGIGGCLTEGARVPDDVCPSCEPSTGGDSGDFPGEVTGCEALSSPVVIDAAQAAELGFDMAAIRGYLAPVDATIHWIQLQTEGGGPASGFSEPAQLQVKFMPTTYTFVRPSPDYCDGTTCRRQVDGDSEPLVISEASCSKRLEIALEAEIDTSDGAVHAQAKGTVIQWKVGLGGEGTEPGTLLIGQVTADLRDVSGRLRLTPDAGGEHYQGRLALDLRITEGTGRSFDLRPRIIYSADRTYLYAPLSGQAAEGKK